MRRILRTLARKPSYTLAAILTIALGVGLNAAVFRVIYAVLLQPLPFRDPSRLMQLWETHPSFPHLQVTVPDFEDWRTRTHSFLGMGAHTLAGTNVTTLLGQGDPELVRATLATADLFPLLGIEPILGRAFSPAEEQTRQPVGLISEKLWRGKFGADAGVIGRLIRLDSRSFMVIGVVSQRQALPAWADFWMPLSLLDADSLNRRKYHPLEVVARLKPGISADLAQADLQSVARQLALEHPDTNATIGAAAVSLTSEMTGSARPSLLLVWATAGLVFLIVCANLAHLFLARMQERQSEMAIRKALGASAGQLLRHILKESLLLAAMGGLAGSALALWTGEFLRKLGQDQIPRLEDSAFGLPVWLFTFCAALTCGLLFSAPACWQVLLSPRRVDGGRSVTRSWSRFGLALMAAEIALAFLVLTGAALLARSFSAVLDENPGFRAENVLAVDVPVLKQGVVSALGSVPGVEAAALTNSAPMSLLPTEHSRWATRFGIAGRKIESGQYPSTQIRVVTPDYFTLLGIPLKQGRLLTPEDSVSGRFVVNETFARRFLTIRNPGGQARNLGVLVLGVMDPHPANADIVGVVGDTRDFGLDQEADPVIYTLGDGGPGTLLVKTAGPPAAFASILRQELQRLDPTSIVRQVHPLQQNVADSLARRKFGQ